MPKIVFVSADGVGGPTAESRKLIRSHCMLGKNRKRDKGRKSARDHVDIIGQKPRTGASVSNVAGVAAVYSRSGRATSGSWESPATEYTLSAPVGTPWAFSLLTFAREIDHLSRELLSKYFFVARQVFYPIQFCVYSDTSLVTWFDWLFHDTAYLESVLLGMSAMDDFFRRTPPSKLTYSHMKATIAALNNRLSDSSLCLADSTIAVVMGLAELAGILSDDTAAKAHVSGFQKMVRLRGGVGAFADNTKLQIKIGRFDLSYALSTGKPHQFFVDPISWSPIFDLPSPRSPDSGFSAQDADDQSSWPSSPSPNSDFLHEPKLLVIFHDLLHFTVLLNAPSSDSSSYTPQLQDTEYQNYICSIQYRLLRLQDHLTFIPDESARLAMLALLTTTFQVAGHRAKYPHLERRFRQFCRATGAGVPLEVTLWLLIVGAMAVFRVDGEDAEWMAESWRARIPPEWDWDEAHKRLRGFPWIGVLHDDVGRVAFEALCRKAQDSGEDVGFSR